MVLTDYTWDERDDWAQSIRLRRDDVPRRVALTAPRLVTDADDPERILLVDPHPPGTWDTWMFPYRSLVLSAAEVRKRWGDEERFLHLAEGDSLVAVSESLLRLWERQGRECQDAVAVANTDLLLQMRSAEGSSAPVYRNFSLKFSATSTSYTAYLFDYHHTVLPAGSRLTVPHIWVRIDEFVGRRVDSGFSLQGRTVSSNVPEALDRMAGAVQAPTLPAASGDRSVPSSKEGNQ